MKGLWIILIHAIFLIACGQDVKRPDCDIDPIESDFEVASKYGFFAYQDLDQACQCSKQTERPILIFFTGLASYGDPYTPWEILQDKENMRIINDNYILTTLYVDDKRQLTIIDTTKKSRNGKIIETIGHKNANIQITHFNNNAQPFFAIVDHNLNKLTDPIGYTNDIEQFNIFLIAGLKK